jgi:CheY-like chemotaxis protein
MASIRAQEQYQDLPLIALTSRAAGKHRQRAMQLGANEYIIKPYQDQQLLGVINRLVQAR